MRVSVQGTAGIGGAQGTTVTPRPSSNASDDAYGDATQRAKLITAGLFVLLVFLHAKGSR